MTRPTDLLEPMDMPDPSFPIKVHQVKETKYGQQLFSNHWHKHLELLYFVSGQAIIECNSIPQSYSVGDIALMNSNDLHAGISQSDDLFYYALIVDPSLLHSHSPDSAETKFITPLTQNRLLFTNRIAGNANLGACILDIVRELREREIGYELSVKAHLYRILTLLLRGQVENILTVDDYRLRTRNLERFTPIFDYIETNYAGTISVESLSEQASLSKFHFSRLFKELTGRTVMEYITSIRMTKAEFLLCNSTLSITEIALRTGFRDVYYFSRAFKKNHLLSPSELRRVQGGGASLMTQ
jgi:AraC-like DNA-binding protein